MKTVHLAFGQHGLGVAVPDGADVITPLRLPGLPDEAGAVRHALAVPVSGSSLAQVMASHGPDASVVVVFPDLTRPMPSRTVLPPLLQALEEAGAGPDRVQLLCATGMHRRATAEEMAELIGPDLLARYRVHDHQADDPDHVEVGRVDGARVLLDRRYVEADIRILTGFVEPHFFAGYSGGPKGACPGLAATETVLEAHAPMRIAHPEATWTRRYGNPVHDFVRAAVALAPPTLSLDVAINDARQLTAVFVGPLPDGHDAACAFVERSARREVEAAYDVVVSTNGGHPLDRNLYQAVKGMAAAERVVRPGGTIIMAAACGDGVPDGAFQRILAAARSPEDLAAASGAAEADRWQAQVLGRVLRHARVALYAPGLTDDQIRAAQLTPVHDVAQALTDALAALAAAGPDPRVAVLSEGPLTVATVAG